MTRRREISYCTVQYSNFWCATSADRPQHPGSFAEPTFITPCTHHRAAIVVVYGGMLLFASVALASLVGPPFFDTSGRLERTTAPPAEGGVAKYVPIYKGNVCVSPATDVLEERLAKRRETLLLGAGYGGLTVAEVDKTIDQAREKASDLCLPTFLCEEEAAPFCGHEDAVKAWLGSVREGSLAEDDEASNFCCLTSHTCLSRLRCRGVAYGRPCAQRVDLPRLGPQRLL